MSDSVDLPLSRSSWAIRSSLLFGGVILPLFCLLIGYLDAPAWQSGSLSDYAQLLLSHTPSLALYPFLLFCITSMVLLVFKPARFAQNALVRFGIYTGVAIAAEYCLVFETALARRLRRCSSIPFWRMPAISCSSRPNGLQDWPWFWQSRVIRSLFGTCGAIRT